MSSIPGINQLSFTNAEINPIPVRVPVGKIDYKLRQYGNASQYGTPHSGNRIINPSFSANADYPVGGVFNGSTGSGTHSSPNGLTNWIFNGGLFYAAPDEFKVFNPNGFNTLTKSLCESAINLGDPAAYTYFDTGTGADVGPRALKLYGTGSSFPTSNNPTNADLSRYNIQYGTPPVTFFTLYDNEDVNGKSFPDEKCWTAYRWCQEVTTHHGAGALEVGVWVRLPKHDKLREKNFAGFSVTLFKDTTPSGFVGNDHYHLESHVAVFSRPENTLVTDGAFPETEQVAPNSYYHNASLARKSSNNSMEQAFPAKMTCKYHYFNADNFAEFEKVSLIIPVGASNDIVQGGKAIFTLFFAENTTYLNDDGQLTGSVEFYHPYLNNVATPLRSLVNAAGP